MTSTVLNDLLAKHGSTTLQHAEGMSTAVVVVALPAQLDPIRLVGEEEKHATLLFLGEMATLPLEAKNELLATLRRVAAMTEPFTVRISEISRLGSDDPPALVAMLNNMQLETIRNTLQVNPRVKGYLFNAPQYPTFTPHVTLGYPNYEGEAKMRETARPIRRVQFDRLALWWGNERLEFPLTPRYSDSDVPMEKEAAWSETVAEFLAHVETNEATSTRESEMVQSALDLVEKRVQDGTASSSEIVKFLKLRGVGDSVKNFLAHFGIKGMRWGVRRTDAQLAKAKVVGLDSASADAARAATSLATIKKTGSTQAISDADLQHLVNRLNLEKRFSDIEAETTAAAKGNTAIKRALKYGGTMNDAIKFANSDAGRLLGLALGQKSAGKHVKAAKTLIPKPKKKKG